MEHVYDDTADYDGEELIMPKKLNDSETGFDRAGFPGKEKVFESIQHSQSSLNGFEAQKPLQFSSQRPASTTVNKRPSKQKTEANRNSYSGSTGTSGTTSSTGTYSGGSTTGGTTTTSGGGSTYGSTGGSTGTTTGTATSIQCWTCRNAYSYAECQSKGYLVTCQSNQESCELEVRERNGYVIQVNTGCKQAMACENNKAQNFQLRLETIFFFEI